MSELINLAVSDKLVEATAVKNVQTVFHTLLKLNATASNYDKFFAALSANNVPIDALLADAKLDHLWSYDFVVSALKHGMSSDLKFNVDGLKMALPCYLASASQLSALRQLLDDGVLTFSACAVTPEDMWRHLRVKETDIPVLCSVMEHFGDALNGLSSYNLVQWIESNRMLSGPLTVELSITPCPYPHLVRAVTDATPINSQAVTIAAKQGFVDWLEAEAVRLSTVRPEGYKSWRALSAYLDASGAVIAALRSVHVLVCLAEAATASAQAGVKSQITHARRKAWPSLYLPVIRAEQVALICSRLESTGDELQQYDKKISAWVDKMDVNARSALASELCGDAYPLTARAVIPKCTAFGEFFPATVCHQLTDLYSTFINTDTDGVIKHLCSIDVKLLDPESAVNLLCSSDPAQARPIVERHTSNCRLIRVVVHHGFTDLVKGFITRKSSGRITSPAWTPTSTHRLSQNDAENAWLWLMIGDGDLGGKVWAAVEAGWLVNGYSCAVTLADGVYKSGRKMTRDVLTAMVQKYPYVLHVATEQSLYAVKCLVEAGADVNKQDDSGYTPLHCVSEVAIARYLVESKADPSIRDNEGLTPLGYVSKYNRPAVADYLRSIRAPY